MAVASSAGVLHRKFDACAVTIGTAFIRGLNKNLSAAMANLADGTGVELAEGIFPCPLAIGTLPIFSLDKGITPVDFRGHFILQGGSAPHCGGDLP